MPDTHYPELEAAATAAGFALHPVDDGLELRAPGAPHPVDKLFFPLEGKLDELRWRLAAAIRRRDNLAKRLHDLRSPLNAIQGYAEMIAETADGDTVRFASNIRTASETITARLESFREEGV